MGKPLVGILMGSESDLSVMEEASKVLEKFGVSHEVIVSSAQFTSGNPCVTSTSISKNITR